MRLTQNDLLRSLGAAALLAAVGLLLYARTWHAPWQLDDYPAIVDNPLVRDLGGALRGIFDRRGVAILTFAFNYRFGGFTLWGYHGVNILLHLSTSLLVYLLLRRVVPGRSLPALLGALLFLVHPLQTQTVNYIVQRMTGLCAFFFFLSLYLFVRARERLAAGCRFGSPGHLALYCGTLLAGVLAVYSKDIALVLPAAQLLVARYFLPGERRWRPLLLYLLPHCLVPAGYVVQHLLLPLAAGKGLGTLAATDALASSRGNSPLNYLVTEFSVLWIYLRLLFLPYGQAFDYSYPVAEPLLTLQNAIALLGHLALGVLAFHIRHRRPCISFGIAWFYLTLAIESSILPLDPLFEHRLYLPMFGFVVAVLGLLESVPRQVWRLGVLGAALVVFALLCWQRNLLWADPVALYEDNLRNAPHSERVRVNLALHYMKQGRAAEAEQTLREAILINPTHDAHYINLSKLLTEQGRYDEALQELERGLKLNPDSVKLYNNLGGLYNLRRQPYLAIDNLSRALALDPHFAPAYTNLGVVYGGLGRWTEAERYHRQAIHEFPDDPIARFNLGLALENQGRLVEAREAYQDCLRLAPEEEDALLHLGLVSVWLGDPQAAVALLPRLQTLNPAYAGRLERELSGVRQR